MVAVSTLIDFICLILENFDLKKDYLLQSGVTIYKTYKISFNVYFTKFVHTNTHVFQNIIHLTVTGKSCCESGDRIVGIWIKPNTNPNFLRLYVANEMNGDPNTVNLIQTYPLYRWIQVSISQTMQDGVYSFVVTIDGNVELEIQNTQPQVFRDVSVYAANPWDNAVAGKIQNIKIESDQ